MDLESYNCDWKAQSKMKKIEIDFEHSIFCLTAEKFSKFSKTFNFQRKISDFSRHFPTKTGIVQYQTFHLLFSTAYNPEHVYCLTENFWTEIELEF